MNFTEDQVHIFRDCARYIDEVYIEDRKEIQQTRYICKIDEDAEYYCLKDNKSKKVPIDLHGYWRTKYPNDYRYMSMAEAFAKHEWVKCRPVRVEATVYKPLEEL